MEGTYELGDFELAADLGRVDLFGLHSLELAGLQVEGDDELALLYRNRDYLDRFEGSDMVFSGFDAEGDPRALEIPSRRFFIGTAFQPERRGLQHRVHPLVRAFVEAALQR